MFFLIRVVVAVVSHKRIIREGISVFQWYFIDRLSLDLIMSVFISTSMMSMIVLLYCSSLRTRLLERLERLSVLLRIRTPN